jgi:hypothetical protein
VASQPRPVLTAGISQEEDGLVTRECKTLGINRANFVRMCVADYFIEKENR